MFNAVDYVTREVRDWRANYGGLTRAAIDAISDAWRLQREIEAGKRENIEKYWIDDDRGVIRAAAMAALRAIKEEGESK